MFDKFYDFKQVHKITKKEGELEIIITKFAFVSSNNHRYIIEVEEYPYSLHAIKFYLKAHAESDNKFNLITGLETNASHAILRTNVEVMVFIHKQNPNASFTFIGAAMPGESKDFTKRLRIYKPLMLRFFSEETFAHLEFTKQSIYLMVNRENNEENLLGKMDAIIQRHFILPNKDEE